MISERLLISVVEHIIGKKMEAGEEEDGDSFPTESSKQEASGTVKAFAET